MEHKIEVQINPDTYRINKYPWELLAGAGDKITLYGKMLNKKSATAMAYGYAKRHGFKVSVVDLKEEGLKIVRRAWN